MHFEVVYTLVMLVGMFGNVARYKVLLSQWFTYVSEGCAKLWCWLGAAVLRCQYMKFSVVFVDFFASSTDFALLIFLCVYAVVQLISGYCSYWGCEGQ